MQTANHGERQLTELDFTRLNKLAGNASGCPLGRVLHEADIVPSRAIPADVVTMYAKFIVRDVKAGLRRVLVLCYPHDAEAANSLAVARRSQRAGFTRTAQRLSDLGALREGIETEDAVDLLWFFLGNSAYFTLVDDNEWSLDKAQAWLLENLRKALF